jgi:hypothetical protein
VVPPRSKLGDLIVKISKKIFVSFVSTFTALASASACDLCGCYNMPLDVAHEKPFGIYAGVAEQFTHFGTERLDGVKQDNPAGEYIDSSITQFVVGASFLDNRVGVQLGVPLIDRSYQRQLGFDIDKGHVSGLGDITLTANVIVLKKEALFHETPGGFDKDGKTALPPQQGEPDFSATVNLTAGIKLPTGDTSRLQENYLPEVDGAPDSGIGAHDLALGTGSVDGIFGVQAEVRYKRLFFQADAEYALRGSGAYEFRYANDFTCSAGPGVYLYRRDGRSVGLQCVTAFETKGYDKFQGVSDPDSSVTELFVGPRIIATFGRVNGEIGLDLPVLMNTTAYQLTPDYRIRAGLSVRF